MSFDSTLSGSASNSYIDVATADNHFQFHLQGQEYWTSLPTPTKQAALVQATNRLDAENYSGRPTLDSQNLQWPRSFVVSRNRRPTDVVQDVGGAFYIDNDIIPKPLIEATCELALHLLKQQAGESTVDDEDLETLSSMKIGPLDVSIKDGIKADRLPTRVKRLLSSIGMNAWTGMGPLTFQR